MASLNVAEDRARTALGRLERALHGLASADRAADPRAALERAALERDCELLRAECDRLRRDLAGLDERHARLAAVVEEVEGRLDGAVTQLDELAGE
jgi:chromosome segregation ATPase